MDKNTPIEVGDRFLSLEKREPGRVVEVRAISAAGTCTVENEVHPTNPSAVGRRTRISEAGLRKRFKKISR